MKLLVDADPAAFAHFILNQVPHTFGQAVPQAAIHSVERLNPEFQGDKTEADGLLLINGALPSRYLMQIEIQSQKHPFMPLRQLDYCVRAVKKHRKKYGELPIMPVVIYLHKGGKIQEPPYCWPFWNLTMMAFRYASIKLWELESDDLFALQQPSLLPLAPLTNGGNNSIVCKRVFDALLDNRLYDLLPITHMIASWQLKGADAEWLIKELENMLDEFRDTPAYRRLTELAREEGLFIGKKEGIAIGKNEGIAIGKEEGKEEGRLLSQRETLVLIVEERFPDLRVLAEQQARLINDVERLKTLARQLIVVQDTSKARQLLVEAVGH